MTKLNTSLVAQNSFWLLLGRGGTAVLNLAQVVLLARYLGTAGYGEYAFIASLVFLGNIATTFGLDMLVMRSVARGERESETAVFAALLFQLLLSAVYIAIVLALSFWWDVPRLALLFFLLTLVPLAFATVYSAILRGLERMDLHAIYALCAAVFQLAGLWLALAMGQSLEVLTATLVLAHLLAAVVAGWLTFRQGWQICWRPWRQISLTHLLQLSWILAAITLLSAVLEQLPIFMLRGLADDTAVGLFSAALRLVNGARMIPAVIFGALFPPLVRGAQQSPRYQQLFALLLFAFVCGIGTAVWLAEPLINWLFVDYADSVPVLRILLISLIPFLFRLRYSFELITQGDEWPVLLVITAVLLCSLPTYPLMIAVDPLLGSSLSFLLMLTLQAILLFLAKQIWQK